MNKRVNFNQNKGYLELKNEVGKTTELYIYGYIVADELSKGTDTDICPKDIIDSLNELKTSDELIIHMNSGGGSVYDGIAIANMLSNLQCRKICYIEGICASIATVIATSCDEVHIYENSTFMIHKPMNYYSFATLNADEMQKEIEGLNSAQKTILSCYKKFVATENMGQIEAFMNAETWFDGAEACKYFDFILEERASQMVACVGDYMKYYINVPKNLLEEEEKKQPQQGEKQEEEKKEPATEKEEEKKEPQQEEKKEEPKKEEEKEEEKEIPFEKFIDLLIKEINKREENKKQDLINRLNKIGGAK